MEAILKPSIKALLILVIEFILIGLIIVLLLFIGNFSSLTSDRLIFFPVLFGVLGIFLSLLYSRSKFYINDDTLKYIKNSKAIFTKNNSVTLPISQIQYISLSYKESPNTVFLSNATVDLLNIPGIKIATKEKFILFEDGYYSNKDIKKFVEYLKKKNPLIKTDEYIASLLSGNINKKLYYLNLWRAYKLGIILTAVIMLLSLILFFIHQ